MAREIRGQIREETGLTASAGIAPNKLIAKIASDWNKPDGQFEVRPDEVGALHAGSAGQASCGVWAARCGRSSSALGVRTCGDLQRFDKIETGAAASGSGARSCGELCRGIDSREVREPPDPQVGEQREDLPENIGLCSRRCGRRLHGMLDGLAEDLVAQARRPRDPLAGGEAEVRRLHADHRRAGPRGGRCRRIFEELLAEAWQRGAGKPVRLLGVGVRFRDPEEKEQLELL